MRVAALDIGTNTILLLVADVSADGTIATIHNDYLIPRLGRGIDESRVILPETFDLAEQSVVSLLTIANAYSPNHLLACGTSFLRDATNAGSFVAHMRTRTGLDIRVLDGEEEARLTYLGAVSTSGIDHPDHHHAVLDIGGGSTELTYGLGRNVHRRWSVEAGCVRLTERILGDAPPARDRINAAILEIRNHLSDLDLLPHGTTLFGVAGTVTTLAALDLGLFPYDAELTTGHVLHHSSIRTILDDLSSKSLHELQSIPQILPGRADILVGGILILSQVMDAIGAKEIVASDRGLRYGMVFDFVQTRMRPGQRLS
ncbi:MAG: hypothetical protein FJ215_04555 [Ignavibacteria bacterium]|nr:hypothetical protein [Ignavibacteria bacterium]